MITIALFTVSSKVFSVCDFLPLPTPCSLIVSYFRFEVILVESLLPGDIQIRQRGSTLRKLLPTISHKNNVQTALSPASNVPYLYILLQVACCNSNWGTGSNLKIDAQRMSTLARGEMSTKSPKIAPTKVLVTHKTDSWDVFYN